MRDDAIDTDELVNSSTSQQVVDTSVTSSGTDLTTSFTSTGQLSKTIVLTTGNEVLLSWSVLADTDSGASEIDVQILRDSTQIYFRSDIRIPNDGDTMLISANFADSNVGTTSPSYKVQFRKRPGGVGGSTCQILDGTLVVTELKK